jgi:hypothetical protein
MPNLEALLQDAQDLRGDLELIKAVAAIVKAWPRLAATLNDFPSAEALLEKLVEDVDGETFVTAFGKVEGGEDLRGRLSEALKRVRDAAGKLPPEVKLLLTRTSAIAHEVKDEHPGLVALTLVDKDKDVPVGGGDYKLKLGGAAKLEFEANDAGFSAGGTGEPVLRVAASAELRASGSAKLPFQGGAVNAQAAASAGLGLQGFFEVAVDDRLYAVDIVDALADIPDPFDFRAVGAAFDDTRLRGIAYSFHGATSARVEVSIADGLKLGAGVTAMLGASLGVGLSQEGQYDLVLRRGTERGGVHTIKAKLVRKRKAERSLSGNLGLTVDVSALTTRVHEVLKDAIGQWDVLLAKVKPFLSPGTALKAMAPQLIEEAAKTLLADGKLRDALVADLKGAAGIDPTSTSQLVDWVGKELSGALDRAGVLVDATVAGPVEAAVERAIGQLKRNVPTLAQAGFEDQLRAAVKDLPGRAVAELKTKLDELIKTHGAPVVGELLEDAGAAAQGAYQGLDEVFAGVRDLVQRYDKLFQDVLKKAEEATKAKITASLTFEESRSSEVEVQFTGEILDRSAAAKDVFEALTRGETKALTDLLKAGSSAAVDIGNESSIRRRLESKSGRGFEMVLLNFGSLKGSELLTAKAESLVDADGNVQIDSSVELKKRFGSAGEARTTTFVDLARLAIAKNEQGEEDVVRALELGVSVLNEDAKLEQKELKKFFESLEKRGLVPAGTTTRAVQQFVAWSAGAAHIKVDVSVKYWFSGEAARKLLMLGEPLREPGGRLAFATQKKIVAAALDRLLEVEVLKKVATLVDAASQVKTQLLEPANKKYKASMTMPEVFLAFYEEHLASPNDKFMENFHMVGVPAVHLVSLIQTLGDVYNAPAGWKLEQFQAAQRGIGDGADPWLRTGALFLFGVSDEIPKRVAAFLLVLARLADVPPASPMRITMTHRPATGDPETVVLV